MKVGVLGISYWCSNLEIREELIRTLEKIFAYHSKQFSTCIPLFTCNRVEIYFCSEDMANYLNQLIKIIESKTKKIATASFYYYFDEKCFYHLIKVVSGLDSPVIGETEIQGQVKRAYQQICNQRKVPPLLHLLFQKSLHTGKKLRSNKEFNFAKEAFEQLLSNIIKNKFSNNYFSKKILFVGFSKINRNIFTFFSKKGFSCLQFFSVSQQKENMDTKNISKYSFISKNELKDIHNYDVIILGSNSKTLLFKDIDIFIYKLQKEKIIFDLGVPRNFDFDYKERQVDIYNMDDLNALLLLTHSFIDNCSGKTLKQYVLIEANKQWSLLKNKVFRYQQWAVAS